MAPERYGFVMQAEEKLRSNAQFCESIDTIVEETKMRYSEELDSCDLICLISLAGDCSSHLVFVHHDDDVDVTRR